ncbi:MAG: glucoamylase family protein [Candidatus Acidiferrales bacterium]
MATVHHPPLDSASSYPSDLPPGSGAAQSELSFVIGRKRTATVDEQLHNQALQTARSWNLLDAADSHERFARALAAATSKIGKVADRLQDSVSSGTRLKGDDSALLGHLMVIRTASRECRQALRSNTTLPHVTRDDWKNPAPRIYALSVGYLDATGDAFDEFQFPVFAQAIQEQSPLQMKELWNLRGYLEFALLERIAGLAEHLDTQSQPQMTIVRAKSSSRLRRCLESLQAVLDLDWKKLFEKIDQTEKILKTDPLGTYGRMDFESRDAYRAAVGSLAAHCDYSEVEVAQEAIVLARDAQRLSAFSGRAKQRRTHVGYYLTGPGKEILKHRIGYRAGLVEKFKQLATNSPDYFYFASVEIAALALIVIALSALHAQPPALWPILLLFLAIVECAVMVTNICVTSLVAPQKLPKLDFSKGIPGDCATMVVVPTLIASEAQVRKAVKDLEIRFLGNRDRNLHFALLTDFPDANQQFDEMDGLAQMCSEHIEGLNRTHAGKGYAPFFHFHRPRTFNSREGLWMGWERKRGKLLQFNRYLLGQEDPFTLKTGNLSVLPEIRYVITLDLDTQLPSGSAYRLVGAIAHPLNSAVIDSASNIVVEGYGILQPRVEISVRSAHRSRLASMLSGDTGLDIYTRAVSDVYQDLFGEAIFSGKGIYELDTFQKVLDNRLPCDSVLSHDLIESTYVRAGLLSDVEVVDDYPSSFSALSRRKHRWMRGDWQIGPWLFPHVRDGVGRKVKNPISHVSRWKILDNLRRALTDLTIFAALLYGWFAVPQHALRWTLVVLGIVLLPACIRLILSVANAGRDLFLRSFWKALFEDWAATHARTFLRLAFLCHQALVELDASIRTLVRMKFTRRRMLEWETAEDSESASRTHIVDKYVRGSVVLATAIGVLMGIFHPLVLAVSLPFIAAWAMLPKIISWFDQPSAARQPALSDDQKALVRNAGLRTWRFFREFSNAEENWLVPDLLQETPPLVTHHISTTNLGLLLNARLAAHDLGHLTAAEFAESTAKTFDAVRRMPKCNGQLYNWYSTHTLEPDKPLFVSTVDNGNLLCSLWALKEGCWEILKEPLLRPISWQSICDHVDLLAEIIHEQPEADELCSPIRDLRQRVLLLLKDTSDTVERFVTLEVDTAIFVERLAEGSAADEVRWWAGELECRVKQLCATIREFAPWMRPEYAQIRERLGVTSMPRLSDLTLESSSKLYSTLEKAVRRLASGSETPVSVQSSAERLLSELQCSIAAAKNLHDELTRIADAAQSLADGMDFGMFFDDKREMLSIGYDADEGSISKWHYDLLPSEARSAAFAGIAQGTLPQKTWFRLGRFHGTHDGEPVLYSWAGTMFEYVMPCLWTKLHRNSLLDRSARAAIRVQRKFAEGKGDIPWGVSECACNEYNPDGHYVYHAFGVPTLALHRDEYSNDVVIAPYATFLAMMIEPVVAVRNLAKMRNLGWLGAYGFYDAIDFTPRRIARGKEHEIVRTWMAHHQGMSLVAISNALCDSAMQRRFHADSRVAAAERVLHEKAPRVLPGWEQDIVEMLRPAGTPADSVQSAA